MLADPGSLLPDLILPQPDNLTPLFNHFQKQPAPPPGGEWHYNGEEWYYEAPEEGGGGMLPDFVVWTFQILGLVWELLFVVLYGSIPQTIFTGWFFVDLVIDSLVRLLLGSWCKPCAWVVIWVVNVPGIIFWFFGGLWRIVVQTWGLPVDGWMLLFEGSGCYLRFGHDCRYVKRFKNRSYWEIFDVPVWIREIPVP